MSCSYDIRCVPCGAFLGFDVNHGRDRCADLVRLRDAIAALATSEVHGALELELTNWGKPVSLEFFVKHAGHELEIVDQYGHVDGECEKRPACACCKHPFYCRMPKDHAGECDPAFVPPKKQT